LFGQKGIQYALYQRGFAGSAHAGYGAKGLEGKTDVQLFEVMEFGSFYFYIAYPFTAIRRQGDLL
jgi:hypothetical protein